MGPPGWDAPPGRPAHDPLTFDLATFFYSNVKEVYCEYSNAIGFYCEVMWGCGAGGRYRGRPRLRDPTVATERFRKSVLITYGTCIVVLAWTAYVRAPKVAILAQVN